jgi:hypothetical protein
LGWTRGKVPVFIEVHPGSKWGGGAGLGARARSGAAASSNDVRRAWKANQAEWLAGWQQFGDRAGLQRPLALRGVTERWVRHRGVGQWAAAVGGRQRAGARERASQHEKACAGRQRVGGNG